MFDAKQLIARLGMEDYRGADALLSRNPSTGEVLAGVRLASRGDYEAAVGESLEAFRRWRLAPAPRRGLIVREIAEQLRRHKEDLGALVSLETGKILQEGLGEVQEMIDVADFALGLSRQLYGMTTQSERPGHRLYEQWHPLGAVGVITAFNFPVAVWAWNALIAAVCGDTVIWKPSEETPLTAVATHRIARSVLARHGFAGVFSLVVGEVASVGEAMLDDRRLPLISATGSTRMGRIVAERVGRRLGRTLLELGGNNAILIMPDADLDLALRGCLFAAVGTAGQRCTSLRRLYLHQSIAAEFRRRLTRAYRQVRIGDPLDPETLMGPLIHARAVDAYEAAILAIRAQGGEVLYGGQRREGNFVEPTIVRSHSGMPIVAEEVFAPILHTIEFETLDEAIEANNAVPQGLSSAIFTSSLQSTELFLSARGSDCGIANVNIGTSGAEIGGAFGGEKDTGGGRESGSDSWKAYMRRQTVTINFSNSLPLAQGIEFDF
ncbi:MAG: aldehyde dehydrogenase family protein [Bryobacter sp.]|jgi:aldehyde dehydrogenase (NAD+)|nr:aldehyde dehydrogenase family protein [Bryobacter sp. CoA8 C33]